MTGTTTKAAAVPDGMVLVPAGELAAFGLMAERLEGLLAEARAALGAAREQVACEIEAEAASHLQWVRRGMRWAAWVARGKPPESDPGNDHELSRALLHGDAERTGTPCCPVETAAVTRALEAERERVLDIVSRLKVVLVHPDNGYPVDAVPFAMLLGVLNGGGPEAEGSTPADERSRICAAVEALKFTLFRPGNGPAETQALDVVPLEPLITLLEGGGLS